MHSRNWRCGMLVMFLAAAVSQAGHSAEYTLHEFKKIQLTDKYYSEGAHIGDFNKDGHGDVVCGPYWWEGPAFTTSHQFYPGQEWPNDRGYSDNFFSFPYDVNGDGWTDILTYGFPGKESFWYENPKGGKGNWMRHLAFPSINNESPTFGDITGDGIPEIITSFEKQLGYATLDPNKPTAPWRFHPISPPGPWVQFTHGLGFGDVNGDGRADLLTKNGWWEHPDSIDDDPQWPFHPHTFTRLGGSQMFAYDVDGDGDNDVITALFAHGWGLSWFENLGSESGEIAFTEHKFMGEKPEENDYGVKFSQLHATTIADVDGDGLTDIITGKCYWAHNGHDPGATEPAVLYYFKLSRDGGHAHFIPMQIDDNSGVGREVTAGDVNGDGLTDVVSGNKKGVFVFLQKTRQVSQKEWENAQPKLLKQ